jgi:Transposase, Mutator family
MEDVRERQQRPLDDVYPVIFLDALVLKIREGGSVQRRACYLALAVTVEGERDVLGMWLQETEGAKFWMKVLSEFRQRGVSDNLPLLRRRAEALPGGDRGDLPDHDRADLHRPPDPAQPQMLRPRLPRRPRSQPPPRAAERSAGSSGDRRQQAPSQPRTDGGTPHERTHSRIPVILRRLRGTPPQRSPAGCSSHRPPPPRRDGFPNRLHGSPRGLSTVVHGRASSGTMAARGPMNDRA